MSTTFGVKIPSTGKVVEVARRIGVGNGNANNGRILLGWVFRHCKHAERKFWR
jgi:hypothetical protein